MSHDAAALAGTGGDVGLQVLKHEVSELMVDYQRFQSGDGIQTTYQRNPPTFLVSH